MRAQLVPLDGAPPIELVKDLSVVGRKEECDVRLDHKSVSKLHCVLVKTDGVLLLRDLGSTNGTRVNGQRVRRAALLPNDKLTIANFAFRVLFGVGVAAPPVGAEEFTQQLDAKEVAALLKRPEQQDAGDSSLEIPGQIQINPLPDVYPEEEKKH
jgi:pSer/pThr/pTyr-binding forkhead associated (FHA) protein